MASARDNIRVRNQRLGRHSPQSWVVRASNFVFSGLVAVYAVASFVFRRPRPNAWLTLAMLLAGIGGVVFNFCLFHHTHGRLTTLEDAGKKYAAIIDGDRITEQANERDR